MPERASAPISSLYIHVPFCAKKCSYCAFYSEASGGERVNAYVEALLRELELVAAELRPETVFFGGGTPSLLNLRQWERILIAFDRLGLLGASEWTVECNPATVSLDKAKLLRNYGVSRVSMGVQSLNEELLERLGRIHTRNMVFKSVDILRQAGFDNLNLDLMFAIPGQTLSMWKKTLAEALALGTEHLSCYEVIYEEDTALYAQLQQGQFSVDENTACDMYDELLQRATAAGFQRYEIANFARDNYECRHNLNYWRGGSFYGLGPSATTYVGGRRTRNWSNTDLYCEKLVKGHRAIESSEELSSLGRAGETAAFGLRMVAGWPFEQFQQVTGYDLREQWADEMLELEEQGWGRRRPERFQLTEQGLRFADAAGSLFLR